MVIDAHTGVASQFPVANARRLTCNQQYIAVSTDASINIYDALGQLLHAVKDSSGASPQTFIGSSSLLICSSASSVFVVDAATNVELASFSIHPSYVNKARAYLDGRVILLASDDSTASVNTFGEFWKLQSSVRLRGHTGWVRDIFSLPDSHLCITCGDDKSIRVWERDSGKNIKTLSRHSRHVTAIEPIASGQRFASASADCTVLIWSSAKFEVMHTLSFESAVDTMVVDNRLTLFLFVKGIGIQSCDVTTGVVKRLHSSTETAIYKLAYGMFRDAITQTSPSACFRVTSRSVSGLSCSPVRFLAMIRSSQA